MKRSREESGGGVAWPFGDSAESTAAAFWSLFKSSGVGRDLTDLERGTALDATVFRVVPTGAVPTRGVCSADVSDVLAAVKVVLPTWRRVCGWKAGATKRSPGHPALLLLTYSARRAADMLQPLSVLRVRIAKLFGKHVSVEEQRDMLAGPPVVIAVGTPNRVHKLLSEGVLSLDECDAVLLDVHPDAKQYTLLNHPNMCADWWALFREHLQPRMTTPAAAPAATEAAASAATSAAPATRKLHLGFY